MMRRFREPFSGFSHLFGAVLGVVGLGVLIALTWTEPGKLASMIVYGLSLILLYSASAVMHLVRAPEGALTWLNRFDHAAIYMLIAGTYTPFCYNLLSGGWRWGLLATVWGLALAGIIFKLVAHWRRWTSTLLYLAMGWLGVIAFPQAIKVLEPAGIALVVGGGLVYSLGVIFFSLDDPANRPKWFNYHDVWHLFVLGASGLHYAAILLFVAR